MFRDELKKLTERVPGAQGALIMGLDGITVDKFEPGDLNLDALSAEYLSLVKQTAETNEELGIGRVQEMNFITDRLVAILMSITHEYFLVLALPPNGNFGRARYETRKSTLGLADELS